MLCGLPGSGKSTLAKRLVAASSSSGGGGSGGPEERGSSKQKGEVCWVRASQDDDGKEQAREIVIDFCKNKWHDTQQQLVLDMCNLDAEVRGKWMALMRDAQPAIARAGAGAAKKGKGDQIVALHLDVPGDVCKQRLKIRSQAGDHPTIKGDGSRIVDAFVKTGTAPVVSEGFAQVLAVRSEDEVDEIATRLL
mmetsp:Transcript_30091/g.61974  ORF Transcript_30091/g.61974 Transcript_30091/m.61974 type:complete len:193 (+) Transcript_30091:1414-1992(+)